jgi:hypothetical protein
MKILKAISLIIVAALLFALTSCVSAPTGGDTSAEPSQTANQIDDQQNNTETDQGTSADPESDPAQTGTEAESAAESEDNKADVTVESHVVFEDSGIRITVKSLDMNALFGPELKFLIENDSDEDIEISVNNVVVNGYMFSAYLYTDVAAGKKANSSITLSKSDLEELAIDTVADIEIDFSVYKNDTWDLICKSDLISIKTSAADSYLYNYDESGTKVYDDNGVLIVVKGIVEDEFMGDSILVYAYNTNDVPVTVSTRNVSVNGFMIDPWFSCNMLPGKHALSKLSFSETDLEENEIESIRDVEITFYIYDTDSWEDIAYADPVHLTFN